MTDNAPAIGDDIPRVDGVGKVTGTVSYAADLPIDHVAHAVLLGSSIGLGRITLIDDAAARALPGFLLLLTHANTQGEMKTQPAFIGISTTTVETANVMHAGQIVGLLVAETPEQAAACAEAVKIEYEARPPSAGFDAPGATVRRVHEVDPRHEDAEAGDAAAAFAAAPFTVDAHYETPVQHQNPIELHNTLCWWSGNRLTVHEPSQFVYSRAYLADCLGLQLDQVRIVSRYCGGGFGGRNSGTPRTVLAAIASRRLGRPVKLVVSRKLGFTIANHRAETRHHVRLAATHEGCLTALMHEGWEVASRPSPYTVDGTGTTARMYACPNIWTRVNVVQADRNSPGFMRCPAELPYMFALESALDELAFGLGMDPIEVRRRNETRTDPINGRPYSSRSLLACLDEGARRFGWSKREPRPGTMRDGDWLVGYGVATACYPANGGACAVRISLDGDARVRVQVAFHEIGNGAYTVIGQTAAALLGVPIRKVTVELGDTLLPPGNFAAGSNGTATTCNAVAVACEEIRAKLAHGAIAGPGPLSNERIEDIHLQDGALVGARGREPLGAAIARVGGMVEVTGNFTLAGLAPGALDRLRRGIPSIAGGHSKELKQHISYAFGAQFVEARVHRLTGEVRVPRATGVFAAGRIMNRRTAHSQLMGGMIWGLGSALLEQTLVDARSARYLNDNLAEYLVATNADVGHIDVAMLDEVDELVNPMGIKGVGELGVCGVAAAVTNAVFHATGRRLRTTPVRAHQLLGIGEPSRA